MAKTKRKEKLRTVLIIKVNYILPSLQQIQVIGVYHTVFSLSDHLKWLWSQQLYPVSLTFVLVCSVHQPAWLGKQIL